jgi:hypothetical protein
MPKCVVYVLGVLAAPFPAQQSAETRTPKAWLRLLVNTNLPHYHIITKHQISLSRPILPSYRSNSCEFTMQASQNEIIHVNGSPSLRKTREATILCQDAGLIIDDWLLRTIPKISRWDAVKSTRTVRSVSKVVDRLTLGSVFHPCLSWSIRDFDEFHVLPLLGPTGRYVKQQGTKGR